MKVWKRRNFGAILIAAVLLLSYTVMLPAAAESCRTADLTWADRGEENRKNDAPSSPILGGKIRMRIPDLLFPKRKPAQKERMAPSKSASRLCPGGGTFGVRLYADGVLIVGVSEKEAECPAYDAGLRIRDVIVGIDGKPARSVREVTDAISSSGGKAITFEIRRGEERLTIPVTPIIGKEENRYRIGIVVRDSAAGIGTVTFTDPETGAFGGLGHGICDADTGTLIPVRRGAVLRVLLDGIERGEVGEPGELRGALCPDKIGTILANTECGVFGVLAERPSASEAIPVAENDEIHAGQATLRCTLDNGMPTDYTIEIGDVRHDAKSAKCFSVHVTDPVLIGKTGGIVQGMSGSPILQDGKLIGAVTHVMIGDPTRGYGIFIGNMLASLPQNVK